MVQGRIEVLGREHESEVNRLRLSEYKSAAGFEVQPTGLLWNRSDDQCCILGAWIDENLIATMRVELVEEPSILEKKLECPWRFGELRFPALVLSKAATSRGFRSLGLNAALRYHAFRIAREWGAHWAIGTLVQGSPREKSMREMGYEFHLNPQGWYAGDYRSIKPVLVGKLDLNSQLDQALSYCAQAGREALERLPWQGPMPDRKTVQVIK